MKLIGNLKKEVTTAGTREEARSIIKKAGILLTDEELDKVAGGEYNAMYFSNESRPPVQQTENDSDNDIQK